MLNRRLRYDPMRGRFVSTTGRYVAQGTSGMPVLMTAWHQRHAFLLASQLPDSKQDAVLIVQALEELVTKFLLNPEPERSADILSIVSG